MNCTCGREIILPRGDANAKLAFVAEFPGDVELRYKTHLVGIGGNILSTELRRLGVDTEDCLLTNLWLHEKNDEPACIEFCVIQTIKFLQPCEVVFCLGSEVSNQFLGANVDKVAGLRLTSRLLKNKLVTAAPNPSSSVKHGTLGEFRLALEKIIGENVWQPKKPLPPKKLLNLLRQLNPPPL